MFDTETGLSTLVLKEIPYRQVAYVTVRSVQPGGLEEHLKECVSFCRMCGAERVYACGHPDLDRWPEYCAVVPMALKLTDDGLPEECLFPVTEQTVSRWRELYNQSMSSVNNAATLTSRDEKEILASKGAFFVHNRGELLGIGWLRDGVLLAVASVKPGAGERVLRALLTASDSDRVTLEVASTNTRAIRLYKKLGFVQYEQARMWYCIF